MHHRCQIDHDSCTVSGWRSVAHAAELPRRHPCRRATVEPGRPAERAVTREAPFVERLAYTRSQAAEALGLSRSTFSRRVLPYVETVEMPWGTKLIPVDELERLLGEGDRPPNHAGPDCPRPSAPRARRRPPTNPNRASRRSELAPDSGRPQRRPNPDLTRRHAVVALDRSVHPGALRSVSIRPTAASTRGQPAIAPVVSSRWSLRRVGDRSSPQTLVLDARPLRLGLVSPLQHVEATHATRCGSGSSNRRREKPAEYGEEAQSERSEPPWTDSCCVEDSEREARSPQRSSTTA